MALRFYQIMNVQLSLDSDSEEFMDMFEQDYGWFAGPAKDGSQQLYVSLSERRQVLEINGKALSLKDNPHPAAYAYQVLVRTLLGVIKDHLILHGAVTARGKKAILISGAPGSGKTTLALELLGAGLRLLSDDICPIHKKIGLVYPFPRSLWVSRQSKFAALGEREAPRVSARGDKIPLKPTTARIALADGPCKLQSLIYLDPGNGFGAWHEFQVGLKTAGEAGFLKAIRELGQQMEVEKIRTEYSEWQIRYPKGQGLTKAVRNLLAGFQEHIWNVFQANESLPDFAREPVLTPIPCHEAAYLLMKELKQDLPFGLGLTPQPPGHFFMELNKLLRGVACYRLTTGRAEATKDLALSTLD